MIKTSLVNKGYIIWPQNRTLSCGNNAGNPERAWWAILARSGSQSECWIRFILPAHGFSHIIIGRKNRFKVSLTKDKLLCWHENQEQVVHTHWTSYQSSRPRVSGAYNPCTLSWIFTSKFGLSSVPVLTPNYSLPLRSEYLFPLRQSAAQRDLFGNSDMWRSIFEIVTGLASCVWTEAVSPEWLSWRARATR